MCFNVKKIIVFVVLVCLNVSFVDAVVINEIMYAPSAYLGGTYNEWIELYNPSNESVDISGWILNGSITYDTIFPENNLIESKNYLIVAKMPNLFLMNYSVLCPVVDGSFNLGNDGDLIELWNNMTLVDFVEYDDSWGAYNDNNTISRINETKIFDELNYFEAEPTPCAKNFKNTSADVRLVFDDGKLNVFPDDADVIVNYTIKSRCMNNIILNGTTNETELDLDLGFGSFYVFANITTINNYNDSNLSNNLIELNTTIYPTTKTKRMRVWTDNNIYELNTTLLGCVEVFSNNTQVFGNLTLKIGKERNTSGYDYKYFLNDSDSFSFENYTAFNFSWKIPKDAIEGNYKAYARFVYLNETGSKKEYNSGNTDGIFYVNGLKDLGNPQIQIMSIPDVMKFGEMGVVLLNFSSNNGNYDSIRFVAYSSKHLITKKTQCISKDLDSSNLCTTPYNSMFAESYELKNVFRDNNLTIGVPVFLKDNCNWHYKNGLYKFYAKAFYFENDKWTESAKTEFNLSVSGIIKDNCKTTTIKKSTTTGGSFGIVESKKSILEIVNYSKNVIVGDEFRTQIMILNTGQIDATYTIQSYVYNGSRLLSEGHLNGSWNKGWDANKHEIMILSNETKTFVLENRIKDGIMSGNFTLKVKIVGDKTYEEKRIIEVIANNGSKNIESNNQTNINQIGVILSCDYFLDELYVNVTNTNDKRAYLRLLKDNETEKNIYVQSNQTRELTYKNQIETKHFIIVQDKKTSAVIGTCVVDINNTQVKNRITAALFENQAKKNLIARFFGWFFNLFGLN